MTFNLMQILQKKPSLVNSSKEKVTYILYWGPWFLVWQSWENPACLDLARVQLHEGEVNAVSVRYRSI